MNTEVLNMSKGFPAHELPTELLENVLQHDLSNIVPSAHAINDPITVGVYYQRMGQLSLVCRPWAALITGTSSFWTIISASMPQDVLELCLKRSGGQSIHLESLAWKEGARFQPIYTQPSQQLFWDNVAPHLERCGAAHIKCYGEDWKSVYAALTGPTPRLRSLALEVGLPHRLWPGWGPGQPGGKAKPSFDFSRTYALHPTRIGLKNIGVKGITTAFRGLESLDLNGVSGSEVSPIVIAGILQNCPDLQHLRLRNFSPKDSPSDAEGRCVPMDLRHLLSLVIVSIPLPIISALFMAIKSIPHCKQFELSFKTSDAVTDQYLATTLNHLLPDLQRIVQIGGRPLHLRFDRHYRGLTCRAGEEFPTPFVFHVYKPYTAAVRFLASLIESTEIRVSLGIIRDGLVPIDGEYDVSELLDAVRTLPITELRLKNLWMWHDWLAHLQSFYQLEGQAVFTRPFPNMTRLTFELVQEGCVVPSPIPEDLMYSALDRRYSNNDHSTKQTLSDWSIPNRRG